MISNFKEEADDKDGGDKEDEVIKINSGEIDDVNLTTGKGPVVGSEGEETDEEDERTC